MIKSKLGDRIVDSSPMEDTGSGWTNFPYIIVTEYNELRQELIDLRAYCEATERIGFVGAANERAKKWKDAATVVTNAWTEYTLRHDKMMMSLRKLVEETRQLGGETGIYAMTVQDIVDEFNEPS